MKKKGGLLGKQLSHCVDTHRKHYEQLDTVAGAGQAHHRHTFAFFEEINYKLTPTS